MFNKERMKGLFAGIIMTSIISIAMLTVLAAPVEKAINVVYDTYRIIIDGADKTDTPEDSKPFVLNGRTYVPLRYIAESMGKQVLWDGVQAPYTSMMRAIQGKMYILQHKDMINRITASI